MSYGHNLLRESFPIGRRSYLCIWCGEDIPAGEKHRHEVSTYNGQFQDFRWHVECDQAFKEELEAGGEVEFCAYDNERPAAYPSQQEQK